MNREPWRRRTVAAAAIQAVRLENVDDKVVWQVSAPVLHLRDGDSVALMALAGVSYGRWHTPLLRRHHRALLRWWGGDPDAAPLAVEEPTDAAGSPQRRRAGAKDRPEVPITAASDLDGPFRRG